MQCLIGRGLNCELLLSLPPFMFLYNLFIIMDPRTDKAALYQHRMEGLTHCRAIKEFLQNYKTRLCTRQDTHAPELCPDYHSGEDRRRNPYFNHTFTYYPYQPCHCDNLKCPHYHNNHEYHYHPIVYRTKKCPFPECNAALTCPHAHLHDERYFTQGEFFRFDINYFKTKACPRKEQHERKVCLYYHNEKDRRRPNFNEYTHIPCPKSNCQCEKSHNKIEQLYHPSRYKSKYCQTYPKDPTLCDYRDFCSFAHTREELAVDLIDADNKDPNYLISHFKTVWCPYTLDHERSNCPYAHNIQDYRRRPRDYKYLPEKCQAWNFEDKIESIEEAGCKAGLNCNKCHGWMELRYHPQAYHNYNNASRKKGYMRKEEALEKKLNHRDNSRKSRENNIETIANKEIEQARPSKEIETNPRQAKYTIGAPYFKSERDQSEGSKRTKAKTGNVGSDLSCNDSSNDNIHRREQELPPETRYISYINLSEEPNWGFHHMASHREEEGRARSQGKSDDYEPSYTQSIKELFRDQGQLIDKLKYEKVNEVSLVTMKESKIKGITFLNNAEKQKLVAKLRQYSLKRDPWAVEYSSSITRFFVRNNADNMLQKLQQRKISEEKLLKLQSRQATKDFSFLDQEEKESLPKLVVRYKEECDFGSLMESVEKYVEQPNTPR